MGDEKIVRWIFEAGTFKKRRKDDPEKLGSKKLTAVEKRGGRSQDRKEWKEM
jgi:hypothetical protein